DYYCVIYHSSAYIF
nr:immunoglobulin light chain junction region [Macaca mulatta]